MNRSEFTPSSSIKEMTDLHKRDWPGSDVVTKETVQVSTLDNIMAGQSMTPDLLVKMDVQGAEDQVLEGGREVIQKARLVIVEVNFVELYYGQPYFDDIYRSMRELGFCFKGVADQHISRIDNRLMFADVIFEKNIISH